MPSATPIKLIECPRDAMQGWKKFIPTATKIEYLNALMKVGYDTLDFGSFVSPKAIPQMADTSEVLKGLDVSSSTKLLAIIANLRGAEAAVTHDQITYLGFPFSISPTFQLRNTNSTIEQSFETVEEIQNLCVKSGKQLVVYLSMAFGNPYGDHYDEAIVLEWANQITSLDIQIISLADTIGLADAALVERVCMSVIPALPGIEPGVHLHSTIEQWQEKVDAALNAGCKRFDGALMGIGGCPMADDELVGNMNMNLMIPYFDTLKLAGNINYSALQHATELAQHIFK